MGGTVRAEWRHALSHLIRPALEHVHLASVMAIHVADWLLRHLLSSLPSAPHL